MELALIQPLNKSSSVRPDDMLEAAKECLMYEWSESVPTEYQAQHDRCSQVACSECPSMPVHNHSKTDSVCHLYAIAAAPDRRSPIVRRCFSFVAGIRDAPLVAGIRDAPLAQDSAVIHSNSRIWTHSAVIGHSRTRPHLCLPRSQLDRDPLEQLLHISLPQPVLGLSGGGQVPVLGF